MNQSTFITTALPKLEDLCCIRCIFSEMQMTAEILKCVKHCQVVCCRDIIRTFPQVIASPIPTTKKYAYVIMTKTFYQTKQLQKFLSFRTIPICSPQKVTPKILKMCIKYTIIYKLLPEWNKVGDYLCMGQDFGNPTKEFEAIKLDLNVETDQSMGMKICSSKIKLHPLSLETLGITRTHLNTFYKNPKGILILEKQKAFILPGFIKCRLLKVSKEIPENGQFKSYNVIRDHWKHMYGISWPKKPVNVYYYQVSIPECENRTFVYPGLCLQSSLPTIMKCDNQTNISNLFLKDFKMKVTEVCDKKLFFDSRSPLKNAVEPIKIKKEVYATNDSSLVKNPCYDSNSNNLKLFSHDPKNWRNLLFQTNVKSPTKSLNSNFSSFSFQNPIQTNNSLRCETPGICVKGEFVKSWLFNSCASQTSSIDANSSNSKEEFEKLESPLSKKLFADIKKPRVRSVETVEVNLPKFKKVKH